MLLQAVGLESALALMDKGRVRQIEATVHANRHNLQPTASRLAEWGSLGL
jgi:hypothetical protein